MRAASSSCLETEAFHIQLNGSGLGWLAIFWKLDIHGLSFSETQLDIFRRNANIRKSAKSGCHSIHSLKSLNRRSAVQRRAHFYDRQRFSREAVCSSALAPLPPSTAAFQIANFCRIRNEWVHLNCTFAPLTSHQVNRLQAVSINYQQLRGFYHMRQVWRGVKCKWHSEIVVEIMERWTFQTSFPSDRNA